MPSVLDIVRELEIRVRAERGGMFRNETYGEVNLGLERRQAALEVLRELRWHLSLEEARPSSPKVRPEGRGK